MAGIDKIYGTQKQYLEFRRWLKKNEVPIRCRIGYTHYPSGYIKNHYKVYLPSEDLYPTKGYNKENRPISNFPEAIDKWLIKNCPLDFIQKRLKEQYNY